MEVWLEGVMKVTHVKGSSLEELTARARERLNEPGGFLIVPNGTTGDIPLTAERLAEMVAAAGPGNELTAQLRCE